jgi:hypothetical protein
MGESIQNIDGPPKRATPPLPDLTFMPNSNKLGITTKGDLEDFILNEMDIMEHLVSGYGTVKLPLPYSPGMAEKLPKAYSFEMSPENEDIWAQKSENSAEFRYLTSNRILPINTEEKKK